jgi:hypothetical protein
MLFNKNVIMSTGYWAMETPTVASRNLSECSRVEPKAAEVDDDI